MKFRKKLKRNIALLVTAVFMATAAPSRADGIKINKEIYNQSCKESQTDIFSKIENLEEYVLNHTISQEEMYMRLKKSKIILLADNHLNPRDRENQIKILNEIKNPNLVVGLELFHINNQEHLDDYMNDKVDLKELLEKTDYQDTLTLHFLQRWGYINLINFLKKNKIKTVAVNYEIDEEIKRAIKRIKTLEDKLSTTGNKLSSNEIKTIKKELEEISSKEGKKYEENSNDFFERDKLATEIITKYIKKEKQVAVVIGPLHVQEDRLPYMIKTLTGIEPAIVLQTNLDLTQDAVNINPNPQKVEFERTPNINRYIERHEKLKELGLTKDKALIMGNCFYINTNISLKDYIHYFSWFGDPVKIKEVSLGNK